MMRKTILFTTAVLVAGAPAAFAQQLPGSISMAFDSTSVQEFKRATDELGTPAATMGRSTSTIPSRLRGSKAPASSGTYGSTQAPGRGGKSTEQ